MTAEAESWVRGDWMQTYTGKRYYPLDPKSTDIDPVDIAHALSLLCRYGGHVNRFYSVAEHCVLMSYAVPEGAALAALLHDATEAYVVDVPRPVKRYIPDYRVIEDRVWRAIAERFAIPTGLPAVVHEADTRILVNETALLMPDREAWGNLEGLEPLPVNVMAWAPPRAELEWMKRFSYLQTERGRAA